MSYIMAFMGFLLIVIIHEFGHFIAAKKFGIKVLEFSLFIGPKIYSFQRGETTYTLRLIPIMAYVKLEGEEETSESNDAYYKKPKHARAFTSLGGPFANLLLAVILLTVVFSVQGFASPKVGSFDQNSPAVQAGIKTGDTIVKYNGRRVYLPIDVMQFMYIEKGAPAILEILRDGNNLTTTVLPHKTDAGVSYRIGAGFTSASGSDSNIAQSITSGYPAEKAGIKPGDRIIKLNSTEVATRDDIVNFLNKNKDNKVTLTVLRTGSEIRTELVPKAEKIPEQYDLGLYFTAEKGNLIESMGQSVVYCYSIVRSVGYSLAWLVTGKVSLNQMMGPIGMVSSIGTVVQQSPGLMEKLMNLFQITALMSIAVGATNLIPFPMLDGNRVLLILIEAVRGKPIPIEKEAYISMAGFVLLIIFAVYAAYNDILRLVTG